jgi:ring-1,2-phenylacetyl-CoA epoxidase subunit PaaE
MDNKSIPKKGNGLKVNLDFEVYNVSIDENKSILEILLDENIDAPHSCLGGICSTCIAKVKSGETEMKENQILTEEEIGEGLILTCQAYPKSSSLEIDYDDV